MQGFKLVTGDEYRMMLERFGIDHVMAAKFFGIGRRTSFRWGTEGPPHIVEMIFQVMIAYGLDVDDVNKILALSANKRKK